MNKDEETKIDYNTFFDGLMVVPYSDDIFNIQKQEDNDLTIEFHQEKFNIKKGEKFDYAGAIKSIKGTFLRHG